jgi:hypothetical protein
MRRALTQAELAERAGVTLRKLADGLEVDPAELVGE